MKSSQIRAKIMFVNNIFVVKYRRKKAKKRAVFKVCF